MSARVHFKVVNDFGLYADANAACGNNFRRSKKLTGDPALVTCRDCLTLCGFDAAPVGQLTTCQPDPLRRAA